MTQDATPGNGAVPARFAEIRGLLASLPGPDLDAGRMAAERAQELLMPPGALGDLHDLVTWLSTWQGRHPPRLNRPRTAIFAANHGIAARGVSAYPPEITARMVASFQAGHACVNQLCGAYDAELRVYELNLEEPTQDIVEAPAMDEAECAATMAYGMMAVEDGVDLLCLGEMGIGNTAVAAALSAALLGGEAADWTGPGTGLTGRALKAKTETVQAALDRHRPEIEAVGGDPLEVLRRLGGREFAAMVGAILAARLARVPVLLDGFVCCAAAAVVHRLLPGGLDHCRLAHLSAEPGAARQAERLGLTPLLRLNMRLGEASGAVMALGVLRGAVASHTGMATFSEMTAPKGQ